jgi:hypothetical protein
MKICWDNLEGLRYDKNTGKWYKDVGNTIYLYKESCKNCGEPFLGKKDSEFCCLSCSTSGKNNGMYGKHHTEETKNKISSVKTKGYYGNNIPTYNTYASKIDWCEDVRHNKKDPNIMEVKCAYCGRWYVPNLYNVRNRIQCINGNNTYKGEHRFYCSKHCKKACPIYHKKPETLMREDAIRAGRLEWLELNREVQPELRQLVLKRDNYTCQKCGEIERPLHCHHILPVAIEPLLSADIDNCITLCEECHKKAHEQDGCGYAQIKIERCKSVYEAE